jgi:choline-sulfatase
MCDELRASALSCYGTRFPEVRTPNIDGLAARGVRFTNAFTTSPICVAARTSLMTAAYPEETGVYGNEAAWVSYQYDRDLPTFPEVFAAAGYRTVNFGKTHLPRAMHPWQVDNNIGAQGGRFFDGVAGRGDDELGLPGMPQVKVAGTFPRGDRFPGAEVTRNALAWLARRDSEIPFLLRVSYLQPHTPVLPPPAYAGRYRTMPWGDPREAGPSGNAFERRVADVLRVDDFSTDDMVRIQADYHALVAWIDDQVGQLLDAIAPLSDDLVVVFNSDHGVSLGEGSRMLKHTFAPESHRIPQIIAAPGRVPAGVVREDICESLDLARTLCGLCGVAPAPTFRGRDLFNAEPPGVAFSTIGYGEKDSLHTPNVGTGSWTDGGGWPRRSCIRSGRYRLDMNVRRNGRRVEPEDEDLFLADVVDDPTERINRAKDPELAAVKARLRDQLLVHAVGAHEPAFVPSRKVSEIGVH